MELFSYTSYSPVNPGIWNGYISIQIYQVVAYVLPSVEYLYFLEKNAEGGRIEPASI